MRFRLLLILALLAPAVAHASDFVNDGTSIPSVKTDLRTDTTTPASKKITASDWGAYGDAIYSLRTALQSGQYHGLSLLASPPATPSSGLRLFSRDDGTGAGTPKLSITLSNGTTVDLLSKLGTYVTPLLNGSSISGTVQRDIASELTDRGINVRQFGAKCDGTTNDATAIQTAFTYATSLSYPVRIVFPPGQCMVGTTLQLKNGMGVTIQGAGHRATQIVWSGASGQDVFQLINDYQCKIRDLAIYGNSNSANKPSALINSIIDSVHIVNNVSSMLLLENMELGGPGANEADYGVRYTVATGGADQNNDVGTFRNLSVVNVTIAGFSFEHTQSKAHNFFNVSICCNEEYGVSTGLGTSSHGGSFRFFGGGVSYATQYAFYLGDVNDPVTIVGADMENNARLLWTGGPTSASREVILDGIRFETDTAHIAADHIIILHQNTGTLSIRGCMLRCYNADALIKLDSNNPTGLEMVGNEMNGFSGVSPTLDPIVTTGTGPFRIRFEGNHTRNTDASLPVLMPDFHMDTSATAPSTATTTCTQGQSVIAGGYAYFCTATNTWMRAALSTF